jgi:hypothetical protein
MIRDYIKKMEENRDALENPNLSYRERAGQYVDKRRAAQSISQVPIHLRDQYTQPTSGRQEYLEKRELNESLQNTNLGVVPEYTGYLDGRQDMLTMSRTNPEIRKELSLKRVGQRSVMNMQNDLMLSKMGGYIPKPQPTMQRAMPWIPQKTVDSRQALHNYNLDLLKSTVVVPPPAPMPLFKRQAEFSLPHGIESFFPHGHQVKIREPVRQMYNRPSIPLYNPNTIYPQDFNEAQLLDRPKPTIRSTFNDDLEALYRRQFKYDAIQVEPRTASIRGGQDNDQRREQYQTHADVSDQTNFKESQRLGLHERDHEYIEHNPEINEINFRNQENQHGISTRDDRSYIEGQQSFQGDAIKRNVLAWRNARIADRDFHKSQAGHTNFETGNLHASINRGINLREDRTELNHDNNILNTDTVTFRKSDPRGIQFRPTEYAGNQSRFEQENENSHKAGQRGLKVQTREMNNENNTLHQSDYHQNHHRNTNQRGLQQHRRTINENNKNMGQEVGTSIDRSFKSRQRGIGIQKRNIHKSSNNNIEAVDKRHHVAHRGTTTKDDRNMNKATSPDFEYNATNEPSRRGLTHNQKELHKNEPGGMDVVDKRPDEEHRGIRFREKERNQNTLGGLDISARLPEPDNSIRVSFRNPRLIDQHDKLTIDSNEQQGPLYTSIRPQNPRLTEKMDAPTYHNHEKDMNQKAKHRRAENKHASRPLAEKQQGIYSDDPNAPRPLHYRSRNNTPFGTPDWRNTKPYRDNREEAEFIRKNFDLPDPHKI